MAYKAQKIVDEIVEKAGDYETQQSGWISKVGEWGDIFRVKRPTRKDNTFSNPRLTEGMRANNTLATMAFRMMTAQDPYFDLVPYSPVHGTDKLLKIAATLDIQLEATNYKSHLLNAIMGCVGFGTTIVQEDYEVIGINALGRRVPATTFKPRSLFQVAFDRSCTDLDDADWVTTSDLVSDAGLMRLASQADEIKQPWNKKVLEFAAKEKVDGKDLNQFVSQRLSQLGYGFSGPTLRKELMMYHGKLDCMNDGIEYVCALVNRKHLVRFHPNQSQHGKRNFRVAYWMRDPLNLDPTGLGLSMLGDFHKSMDGNRQKVQDGVTMGTYNMWERNRNAGIDDADLHPRPLNIIDVDEMGQFRPLPFDFRGAEAGLKMEEILRQEFMAASGATPTLQAILTEGTATESTLAQNEALRNISVKAEIMANPLVRDHLRVMHSNNVEFMDAPVNVNIKGRPELAYPADLRADVDFKLKLTVDKDYKPKRLEHLIQLASILTSTKSQHPDLASITIGPIIKEIARGLGVPADEVIPQAPASDPLTALLANADPGMLGALLSGQGGGGMPMPPTTPQSGPEAAIQTPIGIVPGSPS